MRRAMYDDAGVELEDIFGVSGSRAEALPDLTIGLDRIVMLPGTAFPLHVHPGAHLLYVLDGRGGLRVDGQDYVLERGDSIYVPADYPHGVQGPVDDRPLEFLAFGVPHHEVDSTTRMVLVRDDETVTS
ncbi:cupin domain-containing protein [Amycolatopsis pretoriensis]|uniref:cupin domain-containing protein n=1 Tax=Amycolatopsis pretoriensis TaxID=218821 RepID=UPI001ABFCA6E|nr:cupin domain-containing protein [Amycolatopsis pretoriensis]